MVTSHTSFTSLACLLVAAGSALLSGCGTASTFSEGRYQNALYGYELNQHGGLEAADWKLDNFQMDANGRPTIVKKGEESRVVVDGDGDGDFESRGTHPDPDLRYVNLEDDGVISVRTIPVSADLSRKNLELLLSRWAESLAGEGAISVYDQSGRVRVSKAETYSSQLIAHAPGKLSGYEAHFGLIDVASVEQLELDRNHRAAVIQVALARTDYAWVAPGGAVFPVYLLVTYRNHPRFFRQHVGKFESFLRGLSVKAPPKLPAGLAEACNLGDDPLHVSVTGRKGHTKIASYERLNDTTRTCLESKAYPLLSVQFPPERFHIFVHRGVRQGNATEIPNLAQSETSRDTVAPAAAPNEGAPPVEPAATPR